MRRYAGRVITKNSVAPTSNAASAAKGIWTLDEAAQYKRAGTWPIQIIQVDQIYTTPGTYTFVVPACISSISAVAIGSGGYGGCSFQATFFFYYYCCYFESCEPACSTTNRGGGGGGGGGLAYRNNQSVTPGQSFTVTVSGGGSGASTTGMGCLVRAFGGANGFGCGAGGANGTGSLGTHLYSGGYGSSGGAYCNTSFWPGGGGGGGGGGGLAYRNNQSVTPGQSFTVTVSGGGSGASTTGMGCLVRAFGGANGFGCGAGGANGTGSLGTHLYSGGYGSSGGAYCNTSFWPGGGGGGGAAGYAGNGGGGGGGYGGTGGSSYSGGGGGGGGTPASTSSSRGGGGGGGTSIYGTVSPTTGTGGPPNNGGQSGSGGGAGGVSCGVYGGTGGLYGAGSGGGTYYAGPGTPSNGAVRIIAPGNTRQFPGSAGPT